MKSLDDYAGAYYALAVIKQVSTADLMEEFRAAMKYDQALKAEAEARLKALSEVDELRCFVSARHREFLSAALGAP